MQQMHDAGLSAALTKGQAAGHAAPLHGLHIAVGYQLRQ